MESYEGFIQSLKTNDIPVEVYTNAIKTIDENLSSLHRYVSLKKRLLGLDEMHMYDLYVPETNNFLSGLGILCHNTVSAGMILKHYFDKGIVKRGIWVVPNNELIPQVVGEMWEKFGIRVRSIVKESPKDRLGQQADHSDSIYSGE